MNLIVEHSGLLRGSIHIPASKSHTIRALMIAAMAEGTSRLRNPLYSEDTAAAIGACRMLGARIDRRGDMLVVRGFGTRPQQPAAAFDMANSGTSTNLLIGMLAALGVRATITGDASLQTRPVSALTDALEHLGLEVAWHGRRGCPPLSVSGTVRGGPVTLDAAKSSQYVSSLLLAAPLLACDTDITVLNPTELPYIDMTLQWLTAQNIRFERRGWTRFTMYGAQAYRAFDAEIPGDWSSAAFPLCAAALMGSDVRVQGVSLDDVQGDKAIIDYLRAMGADITVTGDSLRVNKAPLTGAELDLNATPDALPALAVMGCCAAGTTTLQNVAQARVKETDRIAVMARELQKMGAIAAELPAGLRIAGGRLQGAALHGHHDHRVVMALAIAGLVARGQTVIDTAEAVSVTYPDFIASMQQLGAGFSLRPDRR
jgi:3-phosphoshikimate 1-carboxyvinyltransferase